MRRPSTTSASEGLDELERCFADALLRAGLHAALRYLNGRTRHRFTGVYTFAPPMLRSVCLFDRENPTLGLRGDTPMRETYCSIVGSTAGPFSTGDAAADPRLSEHPARESVLAYCGAPLVRDDGVCFGTLCHFDVRPRLIAREDVLLLERVAPLVARTVGRR